MNPINHYSIENHPTVYDEESLTALELVARCAAKVNEAVSEFNQLSQMVGNRLDAQEQVIKANVDTWLDEHPEATTTVQDGAITLEKLSLELQGQTVNYIATLEKFGGVGDGVTDSTQAIKEALASKEDIDLHGGSYVLGETVNIHSEVRNGTIIYNGPFNTDIINLGEGGGLRGVNIVIKTPNYAGNVIMVDYTTSTKQFHPFYVTIDGVRIDNTIATGWVDGSCCLHFKYHKYQVVCEQNINDFKLDGLMDLGIWIEPILRNEQDNPVFNTALFSDVWFFYANCALLVKPTMLEGSLENARGGIGLHLVKFANQNHGDHTRAFMDLHNTIITGEQVMAWDYYGDRIPADGIYTGMGSSVNLDFDHFPLSTNPEWVKYGNAKWSTGEQATNINVIMPRSVGDDAPLRSTGINWGFSNVKFIEFTPQTDNPYYNKYLGFEFQRGNKSDTQSKQTVQLGVSTTGRWVYRMYDKETGWSPLYHLYGDGMMQTTYSGKRTRGKYYGDMRWDTTKNLPIFWNGADSWILADGTIVEKITG